MRRSFASKRPRRRSTASTAREILDFIERRGRAPTEPASRSRQTKSRSSPGLANSIARVGLRKIIALEQKGRPRRLGAGIAEAIAEIQLCGISPRAIAVEAGDGGRADRRIDGQFLDIGLIDEPVELDLGFPRRNSEPAGQDDACLQSDRRRCETLRCGVNRAFVNLAIPLPRQDRDDDRCVDDDY